MVWFNNRKLTCNKFPLNFDWQSVDWSYNFRCADTNSCSFIININMSHNMTFVCTSSWYDWCFSTSINEKLNWMFIDNSINVEHRDFNKELGSVLLSKLQIGFNILSVDLLVNKLLVFRIKGILWKFHNLFSLLLVFGSMNFIFFHDIISQSLNIFVFDGSS